MLVFPSLWKRETPNLPRQTRGITPERTDERVVHAACGEPRQKAIDRRSDSFTPCLSRRRCLEWNQVHTYFSFRQQGGQLETIWVLTCNGFQSGMLFVLLNKLNYSNDHHQYFCFVFFNRKKRFLAPKTSVYNFWFGLLYFSVFRCWSVFWLPFSDFLSVLGCSLGILWLALFFFKSLHWHWRRNICLSCRTVVLQSEWCGQQMLLDVPRWRLRTRGDRAFPGAAPKIWGLLRLLKIFTALLESHLFTLTFMTSFEPDICHICDTVLHFKPEQHFGQLRLFTKCSINNWYQVSVIGQSKCANVTLCFIKWLLWYVWFPSKKFHSLL